MRRLLVVVLIVLLAAQPVLAAIAIDNTNAASLTNDGNITLTTTSPSLLVVGCGIDEDAFFITGITFDGVALTQLARNEHITANNATEFWYLVGPNSGTNLVTAFDFTGANEYNCRVISFTGTATTSIFSGTTEAEATASTAELSLSLTCPTGSLALSIIGASTVTTFTATAGQTRVGTETEGTGGTSAMSTEPGSGAGVTMGETPNSSENMTMLATCIAPAVVASDAAGPLRRRAQ